MQMSTNDGLNHRELMEASFRTGRGGTCGDMWDFYERKWNLNGPAHGRNGRVPKTKK